MIGRVLAIALGAAFLASAAQAAAPDVVVLSLKTSDAAKSPGCGGRAAQLEALRAASQSVLQPRYRVLTQAPAKAIAARIEIDRLTTGGIQQWDSLGVTDLDATPPPSVLRAISVPVSFDVKISRTGSRPGSQGFQIAPALYQDADPRDQPGCDMTSIAKREGLSRAGVLLGLKIREALTGEAAPPGGVARSRIVPPQFIGDYLGETSGVPIDRHWMWRREPSMAALAAYAPRGAPSWGRLNCLLAASGRLEACTVSRESLAGAGAAALKAVSLYRMKTTDPFGHPLAGRTIEMWIRFGTP